MEQRKHYNEQLKKAVKSLAVTFQGRGGVEWNRKSGLNTDKINK